MAKIDVEHRKSTPPWVWIIAAVVALLLIVGLWAVLSDDDDDLGVGDPFTEEEERTYDEPPSEVQDLGEFVRDGSDRHEIGQEHAYTNEGFHHLADAIDAVADRRDAGDQFSARTDSIRARADRLQDDEESLRHANHARDAATEGADAIEQLQQHHQGSGADVSAVRSAANNIDPQTALLDQRDAVRDYFERSHRALDQMSRGGTQQGAGQQGAQQNRTTGDNNGQ